MRKKLILALCIVLSFTLISCKSKTDKNIDDNTNKVTQKENNSEGEKDKNDDVKNKTDDEAASNTTDKANDTLSLYKIDENSLEPNKDTDIKLSNSDTLEKKLQNLANSVSKDYFNGLPIRVKSIDTVDGKKIATINLVDGDDGSSWRDTFQGSTGGQITTDTLIENFLQVNYKGEWIDGVTFLYNDAPIEYDHVYKLSQTQYRN